MSSEEKKLSKSKQRAAAIEALRTADGFLPQYSDFYFEKKKQLSTWKFVLGYVFIIIIFNVLLDDFENQIWGVLLRIIIALLIYFFGIKKPIMYRRQKCGVRLEEYNFIKETFFGEKPPVSYTEIEQAVSSGDIRYGKTGLRIGRGAGKLVFHYEIGDSKAQKHMEECYALLQKHLTTKLPPFEKKGLDLLDKRYFYEKSRRTHILSLLGALPAFFLFYRAMPSSLAGALYLAMMFGIWECISLYCLGKSGKLFERNHVYLKKEFADYPDAKFGWRYTGYAYFIITAIIVICLNYFIITRY